MTIQRGVETFSLVSTQDLQTKDITITEVTLASSYIGHLSWVSNSSRFLLEIPVRVRLKDSTTLELAAINLSGHDLELSVSWEVISS